MWIKYLIVLYNNVAWAKVHITVKELLPVVVACTLWGDSWRGKVHTCSIVPVY